MEVNERKCRENLSRDYVSTECAEKVVNGLCEALSKEREKNMNAVVELIAYLHPLLTEEQNCKVREITNKIINGQKLAEMKGK